MAAQSFSANRKQAPKSRGFSVQFVSTGTRRRLEVAIGATAPVPIRQAASQPQLSAHGNPGAGCPSNRTLPPAPSASSRTDLVGTNMLEQELRAWEERQARFSASLDADIRSATILDQETEKVALKMMVAEAVRRQAHATPAQQKRFVSTVGHAKVRNHQRMFGDSTEAEPMCSFKDIYDQLDKDTSMIHEQFGYAKTVKTFQQIKPWHF